MAEIVKYLCSAGAKVPAYQTAGSAGADVCALLEEDVVIKSGEWAMIPTGLFLEIPAGYEMPVESFNPSGACKMYVTLTADMNVAGTDARSE